MISLGKMLAMLVVAAVLLVCTCEAWGPSNNPLGTQRRPQTLPPNRPRYDPKPSRFRRDLRGGHTVPTGTLQPVPPPRYNSMGSNQHGWH